MKLYSEDMISFINTKEGPKAYQDAISFLRREKPRAPLTWSPLLLAAACDHILDIAPQGIVSGTGSNGSTPQSRIQKYGRIDECWASSCIYGVISTKEVLERLIVCDGQPKRGFRGSVFSDELKIVGVATGKHASHGNMVQIEYVNKLLKEGEMQTIRVQGKVTKDVQ